MLPNFTHIFSKQLNSQEKEFIFDFIKVKILEDTKAQFTTTPDTILCKIPFFVSRGNPYGIFDTILCTFDVTESGNTRICYETFHMRSIITKILTGLLLGLVLFYMVNPEDIFWKVPLYILLIIAYILGLLWGAHIRNKKLFQKIIEYSESR